MNARVVFSHSFRRRRRRLGPQRLRKTTVDDRVRIGDRVVGNAVKLEVDLRDALPRAVDVRRQVAQAVLVVAAAFDAGQRDDGVIDDPSDVRWTRGGGGGGTGEYLRNEIRREGCDVADDPLLFWYCHMSGQVQKTEEKRTGGTWG